LDLNNTPNDLSDDVLKFVPAPNFNGTATFTYLAGIVGDNDVFDTTSNTVTIVVNAVNDPPSIVVPTQVRTYEDTPWSYAPDMLSGSDVDAGAAGVQVDLTAAVGTLSLVSTAGLNVVGGQTTNVTSMTFTGTTSAINAALGTLVFTPPANYNGDFTNGSG